jgi:diguanylate cyclase (GGDEF)-like protein/PAS domain S-box-containing protein
MPAADGDLGIERRSAPRSQSEVVVAILRRAEPLLLIGLSLHITIHSIRFDASALLIVAAIAGQVLGAVGLVWPDTRRLAMARAWFAVVLLVGVSLTLDDHLVRFAPWYVILLVAYGLVFGLRSGAPMIIALVPPTTIVMFSAFDGWNHVALRVIPAVVGAIVTGLMTDALVEANESSRLAKAHERRLQTVIDTAPIGIMTSEIDGTATLVNKLILEFLEVDTPPGHIDDFLQYVHHGDAPIIEQILGAISSGHPIQRLVRVVHPDLGMRYARITTARMTDSDGVLTGAAITIQDVNDDLENRRKLEQFRKIADSTSDIIGVASTRPDVDYLNPAGQEFFGTERISLDEVGNYVPRDYHPLLFGDIIELVGRGETWSGELEIYDHDGNRRPTSAVVMGLYDDAGVLDAFAVIFRDIEERKQLESQLAFEAGHDLLTGLPNRQQLFHTLAATLRNDEPVAVLFGDLDGFKVVNDSLGHAVGDKLLCSVAERLFEGARAGDLVGRLGGDEFVVVCRELLTAEEATTIAERFIDVVRQPIDIDGREHVVSMSIGIAISSGVGGSASELVQQADLAMYTAKRAGRRRVAVFDQEMRVRADHRMELEAELRVALRLGQIELRYQPIVNTSTGDVLGFEALSRWNHPVRGLLRPKEFMHVVDSAGFATALGEFVVHEAAATAAMMRLSAPHLTMSINLSSSQLADSRLVDLVADALAQAQLPASALSIEITEEIVMEELSKARPRLDALRQLGVRFAIDDFGTGYSNLAMLKQFPADYVKIDRSLIHGEPELVGLILSLTRELGFAAIAEGVETVEQLIELRHLGCHHAQGYYFSQPLDTADAMAYLVDAEHIDLGG